MITTQVETIADTLPELKVLLPLHYEELALNKDKVPLDPQYDLYLAREARGEVLMVTLREDGELCGYFIGFIAPGMHYRTCLTCIMDIFFVSPDHRNKRGGIMLFKATEKELKHRGVQRWYVGSKVHKDATPLFKRLGFEVVEVTCSKWIGD